MCISGKILEIAIFLKEMYQKSISEKIKQKNCDKLKWKRRYKLVHKILSGTRKLRSWK